MTVRNKLITAILSTALIPLFLIGLIVYNHSKNSLFAEVENHLMETASIQSSRILMMIERYTDAMKMLANRPALKGNLALYNKTGDANALKYIDESIGQIMESIPMFHEISILDTDRKVVSSSDISTVGRVFKENEVLTQKYENCGYSDVIKGHDNFPDLRFSCHLRLNNKIVGFVTAVVHGDFLNEITGDYSNLGKTGETVVAKMDEAGDALFIVPLRFDSNAAFNRKVSKEDTNVLITQALKKQNNQFREYKDYNGVPVYGVTGYLVKTNWGIVVKVYASEIMEPLVGLRNILIYSYLFIIGTLIIVAVIVSRRITAPLTKLTDLAIHVSKGDFSQKIQHVSKDEIGALVSVFNQMVDELSAREGELSKHRELLEARVDERTGELTMANQRLEWEVVMRRTMTHRLMEINNQLNSMINAIPDLIIFKDVQKRFIIVNKAFEELVGLSKEEVIGKKVEDVFPADAAAVYTRQDEIVMLTHDTIRDVTEVKKGDYTVYLDIINTPILNDFGDLIGIVVIGREITEMKLIVNTLQESEEKYRALVENSTDIIYRLDKNHRYLYINPAISMYVNLKPEDFIGKTNCQIGVHSLNTLLLEDTIQQIFDTRSQLEIDIELDILGGKVYFNCQFIPEFDDTGAVRSVAAISRDITKRIELEHKLMQKNEMLEDMIKLRTAKLIEYNETLIEEVRQRKEVEIQLVREKDLSDIIINTLPGIFCLFDETGRLLLWNKNMEAITKYSFKEITEMNIFDFFSNEQKETVQSKIRDIFVNRKGDYETNLYIKNGKQISFFFAGSVIVLNKEPYLTLIGIDITDRRKMEEELISSRERLRLNAIYLQNMIEDDRKKISRELHDDLSQSLTVLKIELSGMIKSGKLPKKHIIDTKIKNILGIIDGIIDNMHTLVMSLRPTVLDDFGLLSAIEWQINELHKRTGTAFEFDASDIKNRSFIEELDKEYATALYRVFQESVTNVIRHANAEKIKIKVYDEGESIIMEVEDNGKGIDEAEMFDYKSLGIIGMKERVSLLGGTLDIKRGTSGIGTKITVSIPVKKEEEVKPL
ncbi:MAG: PAS domain S-box protein [Nitrospirae bacterium]|nr:PAS domain S-box protein [Nitrospirota bacterium]